METTKIQEFEDMIKIGKNLRSVMDEGSTLGLTLKGFSPDELKYLADAYDTRLCLPDPMCQRYRVSVTLGTIEVLAMSQEYRINYSFEPVREEY